MKTMDLVYVLGSGSRWNDNEIRFSLRSVEKNLLGIGNVYVIGENPGFFSQNVIHIYHDDPLGSMNADGNMALKILRACEEKKLSNDFLFMNDDFIVNRPIVVSDILWLHKEDMDNRPEKYWNNRLYRNRLRRTYEILKEKGLPTIQYDYHAPMLMNKHEFPKVMQHFDFREDIGYTFRSLYGNCMKLPAIPVTGKKVTIYRQYNLEQLAEITNEILFIGFNDRGLSDALKFWLIENFPHRSKYETGEPEDIVFDLRAWETNGKKFDEGARIFEKYFKHKNLLYLFKKGETPLLKEKLDYKLNLMIKERYGIKE